MARFKVNERLPAKDGIYRCYGRNGMYDDIEFTKENLFGPTTYAVYEWEEIHTTPTELKPEETPKEALKRLYNRVSKWKDSSRIVKIICEEIINETLSEYTNDENHDRVKFWREVLTELKTSS